MFHPNHCPRCQQTIIGDGGHACPFDPAEEKMPLPVQAPEDPAVTRLRAQGLDRVWKGKYGTGQPSYKPVAKKTQGAFPGAIYEKTHTNPNSLPGALLKQWIGKVGSYDPASALNTSMSGSAERRGISRDAIKEKIAFDCYSALADLSYNAYLVPKCRLAKLPIINDFTRDHELAQAIHNALEHQRPAGSTPGQHVHIMSKLVADYRDLKDCQTIHNGQTLDFMSYLNQTNALPSHILHTNQLLPLIGLSELLAASRLLGDIDVLGDTAENAGYVLVQNNQGNPYAQVVKVDPGFAFTFDTMRNRQYALEYPASRPAERRQQRPLLNACDIQIGSKGTAIPWANLLPEQRKKFLVLFQRGIPLLQQPPVLDYLLTRNNQFNEGAGEMLLKPELIAEYREIILENISLQARSYQMELTQLLQEQQAEQKVAEQQFVPVNPAQQSSNAVEIYATGRDHFDHGRAAAAYDCFQRAAAAQYPPAYLWLYHLLKDNYVTKNAEQEAHWKALVNQHIVWFEEAAESGQAEAKNNLGYCYKYKIRSEKKMNSAMADWDKAFGGKIKYHWNAAEEASFLYSHAADKNHADAQYNVGLYHKCHREKHDDYLIALHYYKRAVAQGHAGAQCDLGAFYLSGKDEPADLAKAIPLLRLAAEQGHALAQMILAGCYFHGNGVLTDPVEAARLYRLAAEQGNMHAQAVMGVFYEKGNGIPADPKEAVRWFRLAAAQGYDQAQFKLGNYYSDGTGVIPTDYVEAARLYRLAADQGNKNAQSLLEAFYDRGLGASAEAVHYYRLGAERGNKRAQYDLGNCYHRGIGVSADPVEAVRLFRLAAAQGSGLAYNSLGLCYKEGAGVPVDYAEAIRLFRLAVAKEVAAAHLNLGFCYEKGTGVEADIMEALLLYRFAANKEMPEAQLGLGICYEYGKGVIKNLKEAERWYKLAADQGFEIAKKRLASLQASTVDEQKATASPDLAELYATGLDHFEHGHIAVAYDCFQRAAAMQYPPAYLALYRLIKNNYITKNAEQEARWKALTCEQIAWFQEEATQTDQAHAQFNLGFCYQYGLGLPANPREAVRLYLATKQPSLTPLTEIGYCFRFGIGVSVNPARAVKFYRLAAVHGDANAQTRLGYCYAAGIGVDKDEEKAVRLYQLATTQRYAPAQNNLGVCYRQGIGLPKDPVEAVALFRLAAAQENADAQTNLGYCYQHGIGVTQDLKEAERWYHLAAIQGNEIAIKALKKIRS